MTTEIRRLTEEEAKTLIGWAKNEGWNPGLFDAERFFAFDPEGFIGCTVDGELAAAISAISYTDTFGFIGLYICRPDMRGKGLGKRVWDAGMARLAGHVIGLDGVPEQQANYATMGFMPTYRTWRWSGRLTSAPHMNTMDLSADMIPELIAFDRHFFPADRKGFLLEWIKAPHVTVVVRSEGQISAYGVLRRCVEGFKIGPLFADRLEDAIAILHRLATEAGDAVIHIDVPEPATDFAAYLDSCGMSRGFVTARMYKGTPPTISTEGLYGVTSLELG